MKRIYDIQGLYCGNITTRKVTLENGNCEDMQGNPIIIVDEGQVLGHGSLIADLLDEEQECLDNLPESLQDSNKAGTMQDAIAALEEAKSEGEEGRGILETMIDTLEEAKS